MMSPEHDPEAWNAFMCGNAILVSEFAKLIVEEESLSALEFIDNVKAGAREPLGDNDLWNMKED